MEANKRRFTELVGGSVQFVIPVFQRDYNWTEEQCEQLWGDIERIGRRGKGDHFFGPVVYISTKGSGAAFTRWLLIDGQQRLTTVSLLMAAVRDHLKEHSQSDSEEPASEIQHDFLINTFKRDGQRRKLVLRERDDQTLSWLIDGEEEPDVESTTVVQNYRFFRSKMESTADPTTVLSGVGRLSVVDVRLDQGIDDPQQIFESLNSTGLDLTQGDLVRNYVLMGLDEAEQTRLYKKFWRKIERLYSGGAAQFDTFLRDFLALDRRAQKQGRVDEVYATFRLAFDDRKGDPAQLEDLLERMHRHARSHAAFVMGTNAFPEVAESLARVRALATTPAILVMRLLDAYKNEYITSPDLRAALDLIESYLVRRDVCGLQTRSYWLQFSRLAYALSNDDVLGSLRVHFFWLAATNYAFPKDAEFCHALEEEDLYGRQICRTFLERLEKGRSKEQADTSSYSIEHVMPQNDNLNDEWQEMLGQDWKRMHETWLHRLGNLTLTAYNPNLSDRPFAEKKSVPNGFNESPLLLNQFIKEQQTWTSEEMRKRGALLAKRAIKIWQDLTVSSDSLRWAKVKRLEDRMGNVEETRDGMDHMTQEVFDEHRRLMRSLEPSVIEVATPKSVSYHNSNAELVCEVLPRHQRMLVLLALDFTACVKCDLKVHDTSEWKFIPHSRYDAGCFVELRSVEDVVKCKPLAKQALATSRD